MIIECVMIYTYHVMPHHESVSLMTNSRGVEAINRHHILNEALLILGGKRITIAQKVRYDFIIPQPGEYLA